MIDEKKNQFSELQLVLGLLPENQRPYTALRPTQYSYTENHYIAIELNIKHLKSLEIQSNECACRGLLKVCRTSCWVYMAFIISISIS